MSLRLLTELPPIHYNEDRHPDTDKLDSPALELTVELGEAVLARLNAKVSDLLSARVKPSDAWSAAFKNLLFVEVLEADGTVPMEWTEDGTKQLYLQPRVVCSTPLAEDGSVPSSLTLHVHRKGFPVSSNHGNAPMILAIHLCGETCFSTSFHVNAKKSKGGKSKLPSYPASRCIEPGRRERLAAMADARGSCGPPPSSPLKRRRSDSPPPVPSSLASPSPFSAATGTLSPSSLHSHSGSLRDAATSTSTDDDVLAMLDDFVRDPDAFAACVSPVGSVADYFDFDLTLGDSTASWNGAFTDATGGVKLS